MLAHALELRARGAYELAQLLHVALDLLLLRGDHLDLALGLDRLALGLGGLTRCLGELLLEVGEALYAKPVDGRRVAQRLWSDAPGAW